MKAILVPTDFSKCSYNAAKYAVELAKATKAKIILFHVYKYPIPTTDVSIKELLDNEPRLESIKHLKEMAEFELKLLDNDDVEIVIDTSEGTAIEEILDATKRHNTGMIVMGTQGASNLKELIMGSNTANVIAKSAVPVLAVPQNAKFFAVRKIVFSADLHEIKNHSALNPLLEIALLFDSEVLFFTVMENKDDMPTVEQTFEYFNLDKMFERITHSIHTEVSNDIPGAIENFANKNYADLLVTMPQKNNYLQLLFNKSTTRNLVFHTLLPVLCLPDIS